MKPRRCVGAVGDVGEPRGLASYDVEIGLDPPRRDPLALLRDPLHQHPHGELGDVVATGIDAGQRRDREPRRIDVVESDHRHVVGNPHARLGEGTQSADGECVVEREEAVEGGSRRDESASGGRTGVVVPQARGTHECGVLRNAGDLECLMVAAHAQGRRTDSIHLFDVVCADHGDPSPAESEQVLDRSAGG